MHRVFTPVMGSSAEFNASSTSTIRSASAIFKTSCKKFCLSIKANTLQMLQSTTTQAHLHRYLSKQSNNIQYSCLYSVTLLKAAFSDFYEWLTQQPNTKQ